MDRIRLEYYLSFGNSFGFNTKNDSKSLAWVLLSKRIPIKDFFERFTDDDNPMLFNEQLDVKINPYLLIIAELKREIYDGNKHPIDADFITNKNYKFSNLESVEVFLDSLGLILEEIKWSADILFI